KSRRRTDSWQFSKIANTMQLEEQVVSLELAKKLEELGVKQVSYFYWIRRKPFNDYSLGTDVYKETTFYSAFSVAELGELLPSSIKYTLAGGREPKYRHYLHILPKSSSGGKWRVFYSTYRSNREI